MIKKKYPANTPEMKNKLSQKAKSRMVTDKKQSSGRLIGTFVFLKPPFFHSDPEEQLCLAFTFTPHNI